MHLASSPSADGFCSVHTCRKHKPCLLLLCRNNTYCTGQFVSARRFVICWEQAGRQACRSLSSDSQVHMGSMKTDRCPDRSRISGTFPYFLLSGLVPHSECRVCENRAGAATVQCVMAVSGSTPAVKALLLSGRPLHSDSMGQSHWRSRTPRLPIPVPMP